MKCVGFSVVVEGFALDACVDFPAPPHYLFVGGKWVTLFINKRLEMKRKDNMKFYIRGFTTNTGTLQNTL